MIYIIILIAIIGIVAFMHSRSTKCPYCKKKALYVKNYDRYYCENSECPNAHKEV